MAIIIEKGNLETEAEKFKLVKDYIEEILDESPFDARLNAPVLDAFGFTIQNQPKIKGIITTKLGVLPAPIIGESDDFVLDVDRYGPEMKYGLVRTFVGRGATSLAKEWNNLISVQDGLSDEVKKDILAAYLQVERNVESIKLATNNYLTKLFTEGFVAPYAEFGPGSAVYDGKQLFSVSHSVISTGDLYSNVVSVGGNHAPLSYSSLKIAVNQLRNMKDGNGIRVLRASSYNLVVPGTLEAAAREALSNGNDFIPYQYDGTSAGNSNNFNLFVTRDFSIRLIILDTLDQPENSIEGPGGTIGTGTTWFLVNTEGAKARRAFLALNLGDLSIDFWTASNKTTYIRAEKFFGGQALYPEVIVGSKGDGSAATI